VEVVVGMPGHIVAPTTGASNSCLFIVSSGREVRGSGELGLRFEVGDPLAQSREGALQRLCAEHHSQRRRLHIDALDDARSHSGRVTWGQAVFGIEHPQEAVCRGFVVDGPVFGRRSLRL